MNVLSYKIKGPKWRVHLAQESERGLRDNWWQFSPQPPPTPPMLFITTAYCNRIMMYIVHLCICLLPDSLLDISSMRARTFFYFYYTPPFYRIWPIAESSSSDHTPHRWITLSCAERQCVCVCGGGGRGVRVHTPHTHAVSFKDNPLYSLLSNHNSSHLSDKKYKILLNIHLQRGTLHYSYK